MNSFILILILSLVLNFGVMVLTWIFARSKNNYSVVDAVWALSFAFTTLLYISMGDGWLPRKLLLFFCVGLWSLRLGIFLIKRISRHHPQEDGRYLELRKSYSPQVEKGFFWFFQMQALSVVLLSIPFLLIAETSESSFYPLEWAAVTLWAVSFLGEATADAQAKRFKADEKNRGKTCDQGLWKYSRHPNYFFESCIWWSYFLFALSAKGGVFTVYCPLFMLYLLLKVTGVPMAEKQSLQSRGDEYRAYQQKTSKFFLWFPKS